MKKDVMLFENLIENYLAQGNDFMQKAQKRLIAKCKEDPYRCPPFATDDIVMCLVNARTAVASAKAVWDFGLALNITNARSPILNAIDNLESSIHELVNKSDLWRYLVYGKVEEMFLPL